jgi:hypothetical protein
MADSSVSYGVFFATFDVTRRLGLRVKALFGGQIQPGWDNFVSIDFHDTPASNLPSSAKLPTYRADASLPPSETPTRARVAQAVTIVSGGVTASILAELAGRPFRTCQRVMTAHKASLSLPSDSPVPPSSALSSSQPASVSTRPLTKTTGNMNSWQNPIYELYRREGLRPFFHREVYIQPISANALDATGATVAAGELEKTMKSRMKRVAMRVGWRVAAVGPWGLGFLCWSWAGGEL